jgi:hypothetical protein
MEDTGELGIPGEWSIPDVRDRHARCPRVHQCGAQSRVEVAEENLPGLLRDTHRVEPAGQDPHRDAGQDLGAGPDHRLPVPEGQVPDGGLAQPARPVREHGVVEAPLVRSPEQERLGDLADVLDARQVPLVHDGVESEWPGGWCRPVGDLDQHVELDAVSGRGELARTGGDEAGEGHVGRGGLERAAHLLEDRIIGQVSVEELVAGVAQPLQVQVKTPHAMVPHLHRGEVRMAGEGQWREVLGVGPPTIEQGDRCGHGGERRS